MVYWDGAVSCLWTRWKWKEIALRSARTAMLIRKFGKHFILSISYYHHLLFLCLACISVLEFVFVFGVDFDEQSRTDLS